MRLGLFGGTFDPIHSGHLAAAQVAVRCARLDELLLVPSSSPPHRSDTLAPAADRLEMCRLAAAGLPKIEVSDIEVRRRGLSYTVDTLAELSRGHPADQLFLVLGWDAAQQIASWHRPQEVLRLARLVVLGRPGLALPGPDDLEAAGIDTGQVSLCPDATPDIEATEVRRLALTGGDLTGLVPPGVAAYIRERGLYGRSGGA